LPQSGRHLDGGGLTEAPSAAAASPAGHTSGGG
jgi:hypothetical protein